MKAKQIIFLLLQVLPIYSFANNKDNSFKMTIDAISLNNQSSKDYYICDYQKESYKPKSSYNSFDYYPEATLILEQELNKQGYKKVKDDINYSDPVYLTMTKIDFSYYMLVLWESKISFYNKEYPYNKQEIFTPYHKMIKIKVETNETKIPLWEIKAEVNDDNSNFRIYIPSMIKCVTPYFNKNFKGTLTCKR